MPGLTQSFIEELKAYEPVTRRCLERVPADKLDWRPGPKAMTLGELALHLATGPAIGTGLLQEEGVDFAAIDRTLPQPERVEEILAAFDQGMAAGIANLEAMTDAQATATWAVYNGEIELMSMPRLAWLRMILIDHLVHHRGQLTTYFRCLDVPVPSVIGPSADENPFEVPAAAV